MSDFEIDFNKANEMPFCTVALLLDGTVNICKEIQHNSTIWINGVRVPYNHVMLVENGDVVVFDSLRYAFVVDMNETLENGDNAENEQLINLDKIAGQVLQCK